MYEFLQKIFFQNYLLMIPALSWVIAQILKTLIDLAIHGKFNGERLVGAGGMPSSHSAFVCALLVCTVKKFGASSPFFAFAFALAAIVMYDAMGVRLETGKQAKIINLIIKDMKDDREDLDKTQKLKEMVGHTPLQVLSGALLGILISILLPVF